MRRFYNKHTTSKHCICPLLSKLVVQEGRYATQLIISVWTSLIFIKASCKSEPALIKQINRSLGFSMSGEGGRKRCLQKWSKWNRELSVLQSKKNCEQLRRERWCLETEPDSDRVDFLDFAQAINNMLVKAEGLVKLWTSTNHYHKLRGSLASILHIISLT